MMVGPPVEACFTVEALEFVEVTELTPAKARERNVAIPGDPNPEDWTRNQDARCQETDTPPTHRAALAGYLTCLARFALHLGRPGPTFATLKGSPVNGGPVKRPVRPHDSLRHGRQGPHPMVGAVSGSRSSLTRSGERSGERGGDRSQVRGGRSGRLRCLARA